jgi:hypothetical protein
VRRSLTGIVLIFVASGLCAQSRDTDTIFGEGAGNSGRILLSDCLGSYDQKRECIGYISGVVDGWTGALSDTNLDGKLCIPHGTTVGRVVEAVKKYGLDATHSYELEWPAFMLVKNAAQDAFRCPGHN